MNDPLETELESFEPHGLSPCLARGIQDALARPDGARWRIGLAALLGAAASVALAIGLWRSMHRPDQVPGPIVVVEKKLPVPAATVADYQKALARSNEALDALLDAQARRPMSRNDSPLRAGMMDVDAIR